MKKDTNENILSCSCGHCHADKGRENNTSNSTKDRIMKDHGKDILKIILSVICFVIVLFAPMPYVAKLILSILSAIICGYSLLISSFKSFLNKQWFNEGTLMIIATITAFLIGEYIEGGIILILFSVGELLEEIATDNSRRKIAGLSELKVEKVRLITKDGVKEVNPIDVPVGSLIEVRTGDRLAIDGILIGAPAEFDMKSITGENKYYTAENGDMVFSGAINVGNPVLIKTIKKHSDSTIEKIISLVEGATSKKAKSQKFITKFAKIYTPLVLFVAFIIFFVPPFFDNYNFTKWLYKGLSFLVISCPCALVISVPLAFFIGIGSMAKHGILVKGSIFIETLSKVNLVAFDKTGTLTTGEFSVKNVKCFNNFDEKTVLKYVKALENKSSHPIAKAISKYVSTCIEFEPVNVSEIVGRGITGEINGKTIIVGNKKLMDEINVNTPTESSELTVVYVSIDSILAGEIFIGDNIKQNAEKAIKTLKKVGVKSITILSGDNFGVVKDVSDRLGVDNFYYGLLPQEKVEKIKDLKENENMPIAYVGDGINDSPAIASATIGIAMGGLGSDIAIDSSDVVIMDDDLNKISESIKFSKKVKNTVIQNIFGSLLIKFSIMVLSLIIKVPIWIAMLADVGVMLLAILNSLKNRKVNKVK